MARRGKKGGGGVGGLQEEEVPLQALLLADSFTRTFRPITLEGPKVLLPLVNVPLLEYTLELLASNGVAEIFVVCCAHAEAIDDYLRSSKWRSAPWGGENGADDEDEYGFGRGGGAVPASAAGSRSRGGPMLWTLNLRSATSAGDALREVDNMGAVRSDPFILTTGDVVSNMNLRDVVEQHKRRRREDKNSIMTMVFKTAPAHHRTRALADDLVVTLDSDTGQLLSYESDVGKSSLQLPADTLTEHPRVACRYDLLDTHIDVCSPEVLIHFNDNYDYQDIRNDYVHNEVSTDLGWRFFAHVIENEYAARVHCPRTYDSISRDVVRRWTYPMVPDTNVVGSTVFTRTRRGLFKELGVVIARGASVGENSVIGGESVVEDGAAITSSIIGRRCVIGAGARVNASHLWDDVVLESGAVVDRSILCSGVALRNGAVVARGCVIAPAVVIGEGFHVPEFTRLTCAPRESDGFSDSEDGGFGSAGSDDEAEVVPHVEVGAAVTGGGDTVARMGWLGPSRSTGPWDPEQVGSGGEGRVYPAPGEAGADSEQSDASDSDDEGGAFGRPDAPTSTVFRTSAVTNAVATASAALSAASAADNSVGGDVSILTDPAGGAALRSTHSVPRLALRPGKVSRILRRASNVMGADEVASVRSLLWSANPGMSTLGHLGDDGLSESEAEESASDAGTDSAGQRDDSEIQFTDDAGGDLSMGGDAEGGAGGPAGGTDEAFNAQVAEHMRLAIEDGATLATTQMEIMAFKHSEHRDFGDVMRAVVPPLLGFVDTSGGPAKMTESLTKTLEHWLPMLAKFVVNETIGAILVQAMAVRCAWRSCTNSFAAHCLTHSCNFTCRTTALTRTSTACSPSH